MRWGFAEAGLLQKGLQIRGVEPLDFTFVRVCAHLFALVCRDCFIFRHLCRTKLPRKVLNSKTKRSATSRLSCRGPSSTRYECWKVLSPPSVYFNTEFLYIHIYICVCVYIVSLVLVLRNWDCDNWVYQFPKRETKSETKL